MSDPTYAPFPTAALEDMAVYFDQITAAWDGDASRSPGATIRNAIACYKALNERCLRAELALNHGVTEGA
jgi:hypothetical protein